MLGTKSLFLCLKTYSWELQQHPAALRLFESRACSRLQKGAARPGLSGSPGRRQHRPALSRRRPQWTRLAEGAVAGPGGDPALEQARCPPLPTTTPKPLEVPRPVRGGCLARASEGERGPGRASPVGSCRSLGMTSALGPRAFPSARPVGLKAGRPEGRAWGCQAGGVTPGCGGWRWRGCHAHLRAVEIVRANTAFGGSLPGPGPWRVAEPCPLGLQLWPPPPDTPDTWDQGPMSVLGPGAGAAPGAWGLPPGERADEAVSKGPLATEGRTPQAGPGHVAAPQAPRWGPGGLPSLPP